MKFFSATYNESAPFMEGENDVSVRITDASQIDDQGVLVLWGGEDIDPALYGHPRHSSTGPHSRRDDVEWEMLQKAIELGIPTIGICRGAQMLCAAAGGSLVQDVRGHGGNHYVITDKESVYAVNSIHHQQMYLEEMSKEDYHLLAQAATLNQQLIGSKHQWKNDLSLNVVIEPEAVWFPKIKGLAIQWHPEYMSETALAQEYVKELVTQYIVPSLEKTHA